MANLDDLLDVLKEIALWTKAGSFESVGALLAKALPDQKSRLIYQLSDGSTTRDQIRVACKVSPNQVSHLWQRCSALGVMNSDESGKRLRSFNLLDFGLISQTDIDAITPGVNGIRKGEDKK
jgi:hypothetical protein